jgi:hypothetical protein
MDWNRAAAVIASLSSCCFGPASADTPAFDRPGIAFSTGTLPAHSVAWEQGIPDFAHTSDNGVRSRLYSFDTTLRAGVTDAVEVQVSSALINRMKTRSAGDTDRADGHGDVSFAIKGALPSSRAEFSWATLAAVTDSNGSDAFTNGGTTYGLGLALAYSLGDRVAAELYVNAERANGSNGFDVSPNLNFAISPSIAAFVEAGASYSGHGLDQALAGGGFTLMVAPTVQLDLSADFGLTSHSPDVLAGFGISVFFE